MQRKRIAAWLPALCLLGALVSGLWSVSAQAAESTTVTITQPQTLPAVGETFPVTVSITGNPGLCAVQFKLTYDESVVTCTKAQIGKVLDGTLSTTNPRATRDGVGAMVAAASANPITGDGNLGVFTFQVVKSGNPGFGLTEDLLSTANGNKIPYTVGKAAATTDTDVSTGTPTPVTPVPPAAQTFADVPSTFWGAADIEKAAGKNLVKGYEDGTFRPNQPVTRAEFVTMLWRLAGEKPASASAPFADVPQNAWYAGQVAWAAEAGYVNGKTASAFAPDATITRQEAMTILFRYSGGQSGMESLLTSVYDGQFTDSGTIGAWAKQAMYWGVYNKLITGMTATTAAPTGSATRAQIAAILVRYTENIQ